MNIRLIILISLVVVTSATAYWLIFHTDRSQSLQQSLWLEELGTQGMSVHQIEVANTSGTVFKAQKEDGKWVATHLDTRLGFPADKRELTSLVSALSQAKIIETKTSNPEYYHRLGVEEITKQDAQSTRVLLNGDNNSWRVIIGNAAANGLGTYVRTAGKPTSLLVDQLFNLPTGPSDWLSKQVLPFTPEDVVKVVVRYRDNQPVQFVRRQEPAEQAWQLADLKQNESLVYPGVIAQTIKDLTSLNYDNAIPYVENQWEVERLIGDITFTLTDHSQVFAYMTQPNEKGNHKVWFSMPDNPSWVSDWVFVLSEFNAKSYMIGRNDVVNVKTSDNQ
ncbi:DUF4340 domain-containing protein [Alteromonas ponticola]|uniref:DUF4340 domain-containing protein n=1 Tax=Alteromonas aquimaris TaxID=2998417 RepID=A0ABT3P4B3_9ALTE|nr:DUF4340 domain-containing protein [Alteromonas aquimaris]MCW8107340.1 DUF4340 domain-containing protein [Alteromonas aquimaris]